MIFIAYSGGALVGELLLSLSLSQLLTIMASALGSGILIGLERERHNNAAGEPSFAGLRSFTIAALLGALCFLIHLAVGIVGAAAVTAFCLYSLYKQQKDIGSTTELAFLMTYLIGALCVFNPLFAAGLAVLLTIVLRAKGVMHRFAGQTIRDFELRDGLFLLALILIALPLIPNQPYWDSVLNPYVILKLVILILIVQSLAHVAKRLFSQDKALILSSFASGFVSSTATVASYGMQVRAGKADAKISAGAALLSCVSTLVQLLIVVAGVSLGWLKFLLLPCIAGIVMLTVTALFLLHKMPMSSQQKNVSSETSNMAEDSRMFSIKEAVIIALTLTVIQALVYGLSVLLGDKGLIIGTLLASLFEVHAAMTAVVVQGDIHNSILVYAMVLGLATHSGSKCVNAFMTGGWRYGIYFAPVQIVHVLCVGGLLLLQV